MSKYAPSRGSLRNALSMTDIKSNMISNKKRDVVDSPASVPKRMNCSSVDGAMALAVSLRKACRSVLAVPRFDAGSLWQLVGYELKFLRQTGSFSPKSSQFRSFSH